MSRPRPLHTATTDAVAETIANYHSDTVQRVAELVSKNDVVVVGMSVNTHVKDARKALTEAGIAHEYLEIGGYLSKWRERLAIKMWSGWPTFPQVFVKGRLIGGGNDTMAAVKSGELQRMLAGQQG